MPILVSDCVYSKIDCDSALRNGAVSEPLTDCNMPCNGNGSEFCGGPDRLNVYNYTGTNLPPLTPPVGGGGNGGGGAGGSPVFPAVNLPGSWSYNACWV